MSPTSFVSWNRESASITLFENWLTQQKTIAQLCNYTKWHLEHYTCYIYPTKTPSIYLKSFTIYLKPSTTIRSIFFLCFFYLVLNAPPVVFHHINKNLSKLPLVSPFKIGKYALNMQPWGVSTQCIHIVCSLIRRWIAILLNKMFAMKMSKKRAKTQMK